jgi:oligopeptidase B
MKLLLNSICLFFIPMSISSIFAQIEAPKAKKENKILTNHGHQRIDEYYWMNQRDEESVLNYIEEENQYCKNYFSRLLPLEKILLDEFDQRIDPNETSAPFNMNGLTFQIRNKVGKDYSYIYQLNGNEESLFFDENKRAHKKSFYDLGDWVPSPDNTILAISEDFLGRRNYTIQFRINKSGKFLTDKIEETDGSLVWANDNKTVFYVRKDPQTLREFQVWRHVLGQEPAKDVLIYEEADEKYSVMINKSMTRKYIQIGTYSSLTSEIRILDADQPFSNPIVFLPRETGHIYSLDYHEKGFYITSNKNAKNRKILFTPIPPKDLDACSLVQEVDESVLIENVLVFKNHVVVEERSKGLQKIKLIGINKATIDYISFNEETYTLGFAFNDDYERGIFHFRYNSFTTPPSLYNYNLNTGKKELYHQRKLIDPNFKSENYDTKRVWAIANDGTKIPVSMVFKKGIDLSKAPILLYGYGSYGYTIPDVFSATRLSILDRGFIFAIVHVRGGKYMGESWYDDGKFLKKKNTFTDFINSAEYLGRNGLCDPEKIYALGGSAGGLLMGAITNLAPYLWKGIVSQVPFVDVVTTMLDESIPLTVGEYEEWGNPNDEQYYQYLLSYSPYDNLRKTNYPAIFITTGYHDSQVQYWEPLKYVAKMRDLKTDNHPLLLDCNMDAGHGGGSGRTAERKEIAKMYSFILDLEGFEK